MEDPTVKAYRSSTWNWKCPTCGEYNEYCDSVDEDHEKSPGVVCVKCDKIAYMERVEEETP